MPRICKHSKKYFELRWEWTQGKSKMSCTHTFTKNEENTIFNDGVINYIKNQKGVPGYVPTKRYTCCKCGLYDLTNIIY